MVIETSVIGVLAAPGEPAGPWLVEAEEGGGMPLRRLLAAAVSVEVAEVERRRLAEAGRPQTAAQIARQATAGRVVPTGARGPQRRIDVAAATRAVFDAVDRGMLLVFVDGRQVTELDAMVAVTADTRLRCVALAPIRWED